MPFRNCRMYVLIGSPCSEGHAKKATSGRLAVAWANTARGHAAAPPSSVMNERRLMGTLVRLRAAQYHAVAEERRCASQQKLRANVADGSNSVSRGWYSLIFEPPPAGHAEVPFLAAS